MTKLLRLAAALILLTLCFTVTATAEDILSITLARGERWTIPAGRTGTSDISDKSVVALEDGQLVGLKPGRAEVRISGEQDTLIQVLVLYTAAAQPAEDDDQDSTPAHPTSDYRYYAVSDSDDTEDDAPDAPVADPEDETEPSADASVSDATKSETLPAPETPSTDSSPAAEDAEEKSPKEPEAPVDSAYTNTDISIQSYDQSAVPAAINTVIDFALDEWRTAANKTFSRAGSKNKYSFWQCGKGPKCNIGWCGAFLGYVFDTCGIPMDEPTKSVPHESGTPYSVRAAGVGKINKGFEKMERLSMVPQPGYLVVYGEQKAYGYKHIGLVTDVDDLGGGIYLLKTVEGNMSNRIKRYCYLFDSNEAIKNTKPCPEEYRRSDGEINDYEHIKKWCITTFCQTWF